LDPGTRFFEAALYYGAAYFGSLVALVTVLALTGIEQPSEAVEPVEAI